LDEMADAEVRPMLPVYSEKHLSLLWILDQNSASSKVFTGRQVRKISGERFGNGLDYRGYS